MIADYKIILALLAVLTMLLAGVSVLQTTIMSNKCCSLDVYCPENDYDPKKSIVYQHKY